MLKDFKIIVDLEKSVRNQVYTVNSNDLGTLNFAVTINKSGVPADLTGLTARVAVKKPDGNTVFLDGAITNAVMGECDFLLTTQAYTVGGAHKAEVMLYEGTEKVAVSSDFMYTVAKGVMNDDTLESTNEWPVIQQLLVDGPVAIDDANTAAANAQQVADENKTRYLAAVDTVATRDTTYPTPTHGDTVRVTGEAKSYRFVDGTGWVVTDIYNPTAIDEVNAQLAETETQLLGKQFNYVDLLSKLSNVNPKMSVKIDIVSSGLKQFTVNTALSDSEGIAYEFTRNVNDDFIMMHQGDFGATTPIYAVTESKNYDTKTGTFTEAYPPNFWTTTIGDSIEAQFHGTKIEFYSYCNDQGGLWEFILDEGTGGEQRKEVSVYYGGTANYFAFTLFENLDLKKHTVKGVFKGDDPVNPPSGGAGTGRGWFYVGGLREQDTKRTFNVYNDTFTVSQDVDVMYDYSNKEFALECRPFESTEGYNYIPEHNSTGTAFKLEEPKLLINGKDAQLIQGQYFVDVNTVQLIQKVKGIHPSDTVNPLMEITIFHTIKNGIVDISGKIEFLRKTSVANGYFAMLPYYVAFAKKIKSSIDNVYEVRTSDTKTTEYTPEGDKAFSYVLYNDVDKPDLALAVTIDNPYKTFRYDKANRGSQFSWIEHRNSTLGKMYWHVYSNATIEAGEIDNFHFQIMIGKVSGISSYV